MQSVVLVASPNVKSLCDMNDLFIMNGYEVVQGANSAEVVTLVKSHSPGIILVSEDMPPLDGTELVPMLRRLTAAPMIVLGQGGSTALIKYILHGADAYITGPLNGQELLARVRNLLRRARPDRRLTTFNLDSSWMDNLLSKVKSPLTKTEMRLFRCLAEQRGRLLSRDELMGNVWGKPVKGERLRFYVYSLRRKLGRRNAFKLHTQKGVGYRLIEANSTREESACG